MATQDLTTLASFREYQAVSGAAATALEDRIETLITVASDAIMDFCQQQFAPVVASGSYDFRYDGRGVMSLAPYCCRSITSVTIDVDTDDSETLDADVYRLGPLPAKNGVYNVLHLYGIRVAGSLADAAPSYRVVRVTGAWGYTTVPGPVREATNMTVGYIMRTMSQHQGDELDMPGASWNGSGVLIPGTAKRLLAPYRKWSVGG
jgi:hypothetical protein